ncbi:ArnT family glycosyltransferase [Thermodesulfobacteriota bacterium]
MPWFWLLALTILYIAVRLPFLDHPLAWDEAWILNALKSMAEGSNTGFSNQLRRHPPIYLGLGLALFPHKPDFAIRMQVLSLIINTGALLFFILLVAKIFHRRIAIYTGIAYSLLPGTIFFSTWIKRDSLVILFCIAALWAFFHRKYLLSGLFLAIGFLSKETAFFYAAGIFLMVPFQHSKKSNIRILVEIFLPIILVSCWWYFFFAIGTKGFFSFFQGTSEEANLFVQPWWYYWVMIKDDLGWPGLLLFGTGLLALLPAKKSFPCKVDLWDFLKKKRLLPLFMILPGYLLLSLSHGKPPWMTVALYPFLALLVGLGWHLIVNNITKLITKKSGKSFQLYTVISILPLILILGAPLSEFNYMQHLSKISPGTANVIIRSYRIAEAINTSTAENEKLLMLPMIIQPALGTQPDPIVYWNLKPSLNIYRVKTLDLDYNAVKDIIIQQQIHWLLIFPVEGSNQLAIIEKIINESDPVGLNLPGMTLLLKVDQYWRN